jgi:hypothetical protein
MALSTVHGEVRQAATPAPSTEKGVLMGKRVTCIRTKGEKKKELFQ